MGEKNSDSETGDTGERKEAAINVSVCLGLPTGEVRERRAQEKEKKQ